MKSCRATISFRTSALSISYQYVVYHFLLDSRDSPPRLFNTKMVLELSDDRLEAIAREDGGILCERERLLLKSRI